MKIHYLQHVPFENPANILNWGNNKQFQLSSSLLFEDHHYPSTNDFDALVVMGGPMNIYEEKDYPWLKEEKKFIEQTIKSGKKILGICLGAQLIADVLGAKVTKGKEKEIGWFPIELTEDGKNQKEWTHFSEKEIVYHWHGDTFAIPSGAKRLARSTACDNQAFVYNNQVFALQFHIESNLESVSKLIDNCRDEILKAPYIQSEEIMLENKEAFNGIEKILYPFLDQLFMD